MLNVMVGLSVGIYLVLKSGSMVGVKVGDRGQRLRSTVW